MTANRGFDLAQLDSVTANLDLSIAATQELDIAVLKPAQIPSRVQSGSELTAKRIIDKTFGSQRRPIPITSGDSIPTNVYLSNDTHPALVPLPVQDPHALIGQGAAIGNAFPGRIDLTNRIKDRPD